jgi:hypothetical protein
MPLVSSCGRFVQALEVLLLAQRQVHGRLQTRAAANLAEGQGTSYQLLGANDHFTLFLLPIGVPLTVPVYAQVQTLCVWCLNPAVAFTALADQARTVVLTSGTLAPIETLRTELGAAFPIHLEAKHVIDVEKQLWVGTIPRGRSNVAFNAVFKNADTFSFQGTPSRMPATKTHW